MERRGKEWYFVWVKECVGVKRDSIYDTDREAATTRLVSKDAVVLRENGACDGVMCCCVECW